MSLALSFDTLAYVKRLRAAEVPEKQAEAQAEALRAALDMQEVATKTDLRALEASTDSKFELLRKEMELMRNELLRKLGGELKVHRYILGVLSACMGLVMTGMVALIFKAYF